MSSRARVPRRSPRHRLGRAVSFAMLAAAGPAAAAALPTPPSAEARSVAVSPPLCRADSFEIVPFLDSLRVELAGRGLSCCTLAHPGDGTEAAGTLLVRVEIVPCAADADRLQVSARAPVDSLAVERELSLADVARTARPRALALAVAELIRWLEQGVGGTKTPEAVAAADGTSPPIADAPAVGRNPAGRALHSCRRRGARFARAGHDDVGRASAIHGSSASSARGSGRGCELRQRAG